MAKTTMTPGEFKRLSPIEKFGHIGCLEYAAKRSGKRSSFVDDDIFIDYLELVPWELRFVNPKCPLPNIVFLVSKVVMYPKSVEDEVAH